ncbi:hypothetical protein DPMN_069227 [Dreissena polymorpha]|uniref:Uncharacterized protein n=1 Tax=Dreissena polymorpha TaxID=45954 RepID=A0A9D3YYM8_DREPO|nr:hypothetical protein DPMN_069227 [Dreissena polymorpha]
MKAVRVPKTGALSECHRHSPGLRRSITGDDRADADAGIDTVSAGGVTVYRALPGRCRLSPGHYRRQPGLCRDAAGFHRGSTGDNRVRVDRDSAGLLTGFNRGGTGK